MNVLAINGSARKDGNTAILLDTALEPLRQLGFQTELIQLSGMEIHPCKACWGCGGQKNCLVHDDFCAIFDRMMAADAIILGSPVYSANISARMQALLERAAVVIDMNHELLHYRHKVSASVAVARRGGALQAIDTMNHFFLNHEMIVAGSSYWNIAYGQMSGDVLNDQEGLATMRSLGQNIGWLLQKLNREV